MDRIRCNSCGLKGCTSYESKKVAKGCRMFMPFDNMKTPMLMHLMEGYKATNTTKVLEEFGFQIEEIGTYPYFNLHLKGRR